MGRCEEERTLPRSADATQRNAAYATPEMPGAGAFRPAIEGTARRRPWYAKGAMFAAPTFPEDFNLADYFLFDRLAEGLGGKDAIRFGERRYTYADVAERTRALAGFFAAAGV